MQVINAATELHPGQRPVCAALGIFDGVHLGHQALLQTAREAARRHSGIALAITFDCHPNAVVAPDRVPPMIHPLPQRIQLLERLGMDATLVLPFDRPFSQVPAETFIRQLCTELGSLQCLSVGQHFTFGHQRGGNVELLTRLGKELGFEALPVPPITSGGRVISSTWIRDAIGAGDLDLASRLLGRPYSLRSVVIPGDQLGRTLGFPTANLDISDLVTPPPGVYAARAIVSSSTVPAVLNIGSRPTLHNPNPTRRFEVHLLNGSPDLYGQSLEVFGLHRLRDEHTFSSLDALRDQIRRDVDQARSVLGAERENAHC